MKIGIYTIHACNNFGAVLQAYATATYLRNQGYDSELVNIMSKDQEKRCRYIGKWTSLKGIICNILSSVNPKIHAKSKNFTEFRNRLPLSKRYYCNSEYVSNPINYDLHLVGSDQVWNVERGLGDCFYYLPFLNNTTRKASFASSFGNVQAAQKYKDEIKAMLSTFSSISVREEDACEFLCNDCNLKAVNVLDPTFLLSSREWDEISGAEAIIKSKYILYYGFDHSEECGDILKEIKKLMGFPVIGISVGTRSPYHFDCFYQEAGPNEFLNLIKNASLVLTSSFHGMALSLNFRKQFIVIKHGTRMSRMESTLSQFGLKDRIIVNKSELHKMLKVPIDYDSHNSVIDARIRNSQEQIIQIVKSQNINE